MGVTVGDSMFAIYKRTYTETLESLLKTTVECNAISGAGIDAIFRQRACSMDSQCVWSVMNDAPARSIGSPQWMQTFERFLQRELDANRKVIIVGYPTFFATAGNLEQYHRAMDIYSNAAADRDNVWFVDPRQNPIWQSSLDEMYAPDKKHPSAKGQQVFASEINKIIRGHSFPPNPPPQPTPSLAPTTPPVSPTTQPPDAWPLECGPTCKCLHYNGLPDAEKFRFDTQRECEDKAIGRGHAYIQYNALNKKCATTNSCSRKIRSRCRQGPFQETCRAWNVFKDPEDEDAGRRLANLDPIGYNLREFMFV